MSTKRFARRCLQRVGLDVKRFDPHTSESTTLARQLLRHEIDVVVDVGANTGQFVSRLREAGFLGRIVSFEASSRAHLELTKRALRDKNWTIAPRMALGDRDGTTVLNLSGNSGSSSVLPMLPSHVSADPKSRYVGTETVDLRKLDSIGAEFVSYTDRVFLKLDVQGFEHNVIQGATQFLKRVAGIQTELSLVPLYEGTPLFHSMLAELEDRGFELWDIRPAFVNPTTCRLLQLDGILFRTGPVAVDR